MYDIVLVFLFFNQPKIQCEPLNVHFFISSSLLKFGDFLLKCMLRKLEKMKEKLSSIIHSLRYSYFSQCNLDFEQSLFLLGPSSKTPETRK